MTRPAEPRVDIHTSWPATWLPVPDGKALPANFRATIDDPASPYVIRLDVTVRAGSPAVRQLVIEQRNPPARRPVTTVRGINVGDLLGLAVDAAIGEQHTHCPPVTQLDADRLDTVARAYRNARAARRPVRQAVMTACGVQSSQAARLIRAARQAGKLEPRHTSSPAANRLSSGSFTSCGHIRFVVTTFVRSFAACHAFTAADRR